MADSSAVLAAAERFLGGYDIASDYFADAVTLANEYIRLAAVTPEEVEGIMPTIDLAHGRKLEDFERECREFFLSKLQEDDGLEHSDIDLAGILSSHACTLAAKLTPQEQLAERIRERDKARGVLQVANETSRRRGEERDHLQSELAAANKRFADLPDKYSKDGDSQTIGQLVEMLTKAKDCDEFCDIIDREFLFGAHGQWFSRDYPPHNLLRDIRGLVWAVIQQLAAANRGREALAEPGQGI